MKFKTLSEQDIEDYLKTNESFDKAGAYGIQGYGALLVEEIRGDYFNIVGLPISRLGDLLKKYFSINLFMECDLSEKSFNSTIKVKEMAPEERPRERCLLKE